VSALNVIEVRTEASEKVRTPLENRSRRRSTRSFCVKSPEATGHVDASDHPSHPYRTAWARVHHICEIKRGRKTSETVLLVSWLYRWEDIKDHKMREQMPGGNKLEVIPSDDLAIISVDAVHAVPVYGALPCKPCGTLLWARFTLAVVGGKPQTLTVRRHHVYPRCIIAKSAPSQ